MAKKPALRRAGALLVFHWEHRQCEFRTGSGGKLKRTRNRPPEEHIAMVSERIDPEHVFVGANSSLHPLEHLCAYGGEPEII